MELIFAHNLRQKKNGKLLKDCSKLLGWLRRKSKSEKGDTQPTTEECLAEAVRFDKTNSDLRWQ